MHEVVCTRWKSVLWLLHLNDRLSKLCSYRLLPRTSPASATIPATAVWPAPRISHRRATTPLAPEPMRKRQLISLISMAIFSCIRGCLHGIRKNQLVHKVINHFEVLLQLSLQSNVQKLLDVPEHINISLEYHGVKVTKSLAKASLELIGAQESVLLGTKLHFEDPFFGGTTSRHPRISSKDLTVGRLDQPSELTPCREEGKGNDVHNMENDRCKRYGEKREGEQA